jgi:hypothetical protein
MTVMKRITVILFLLVVLSSCFLSSQYRKTTFMYSTGSKFYSIPIIVPKGYTKERTEVDSSGNTILSYTYGEKTTFYVAHLEDSSKQLQPIDKKQNKQQIDSVTGLVMYKGLDSNALFWKEIQGQNFRTGYRYVPKSSENKFDSAANYCALQTITRNGF